MGAAVTDAARPWTWGTTLLGVLLGLGLGWLTWPEPERSLDSAALDVERLSEEVAIALGRKTNPLDRVGRLARLLATSPAATDAPASVEAVRREIERGRILNGEVEHAVFAAWWARVDAPAAHAWSRLGPQGSLPRVFVALFEEWAAQDAPAAVRAAVADPFVTRRQRALAATLIGAPELREARPEAWGALLAEIPDRIDRRAALTAAMDRRLRSKGLESFVADAGRLAASLEPSAADDVAAAAALAIAPHTPRSSVGVLATILDSGRSLPPGVARDVAGEWDDREPLATIEWLGSLEPSEEQREAVRLAFHSWISQDRAGALNWAAGQVDSTEGWLQPALVTYGFNLGHSDRERGLELLLSLPGDSQQARFVRHIFAEWREEDPAAAERWLAAADLAPPFKQALRTFQMRYPHRMELESLEPDQDSGQGSDPAGSDRGRSGGGG
jgi:hypothetical protein